MIETSISHYRLLNKIGQGGMGVIYKAEDVDLGRFVALKFLPNDFSRDPQSKARFKVEARLASLLNHPNICTIYEIGEEGGRIFIAMEYLEGRCLKRIVGSGPLSVGFVLDIGVDVTEGLAAAHAKSIIHRDIKPGNIFLTNSGRAKILDFGVAKLAPSSVFRSRGPIPEVETVTMNEDFSGRVIGTPQYMSPEQLLGEALDARSDLFSFGVVLYEMATGRLPFRCDSYTATVVSIVNERPARQPLMNPAVPPGLVCIISKCLEKEPDKRYQHAADVCAELNRLKRSYALESTNRASRFRNKAADVLAAVRGLFYL